MKVNDLKITLPLNFQNTLGITLHKITKNLMGIGKISIPHVAKLTEQTNGLQNITPKSFRLINTSTQSIKKPFLECHQLLVNKELQHFNKGVKGFTVLSTKLLKDFTKTTKQLIPNYKISLRDIISPVATTANIEKVSLIHPLNPYKVVPCQINSNIFHGLISGFIRNIEKYDIGFTSKSLASLYHIFNKVEKSGLSLAGMLAPMAKQFLINNDLKNTSQIWQKIMSKIYALDTNSIIIPCLLQQVSSLQHELHTLNQSGKPSWSTNLPTYLNNLQNSIANLQKFTYFSIVQPLGTVVQNGTNFANVANLYAHSFYSLTTNMSILQKKFAGFTLEQFTKNLLHTAYAMDILQLELKNLANTMGLNVLLAGSKSLYKQWDSIFKLCQKIMYFSKHSQLDHLELSKVKIANNPLSHKHNGNTKTSIVNNANVTVYNSGNKNTPQEILAATNKSFQQMRLASIYGK